MLKKIKGFVCNRRKEFVQMGLMLGIAVLGSIMPNTCGATTGYASYSSSAGTMPWTNALNNIAVELTGPIPKFIGIIAIAVSGAMLAFGEMGAGAKKAIQIVFGISIALCAATFVSWMGTEGNSSGLLF